MKKQTLLLIHITNHHTRVLNSHSCVPNSRDRYGNAPSPPP